MSSFGSAAWEKPGSGWAWGGCYDGSMPLWRPEVIDGRGRPRRLLPPPVALAVAGAIDRAWRREATRRLQIESAVIAEGAPISASAMYRRAALPAAALVVLAGVGFGTGVVNPAPAAIFGVLIPLTTMLWLMAESRRQLAEELAAAYADVGMCPACGYGLGDAAAAEDDGCEVCAECGAAWRLAGTAAAG